MPYNSVDDLPAYVKKYSSKVKRQWMHVFNTVYEDTNSEGRAMKAANSVLKKRFKKGSEEHVDNFSFIVDTYLGNLKG